MTTFQFVLSGILFLCIGGSGFFSGSETALVAMPRERVHQLAEQGARGRRLAELTKDLEKTIGVLLVANNFVNILAASIATILAVDFITAISDPQRGETLGPWVATLILTAVILIVGEITPKTYAARRPDRWALRVATPLWWIARGLAPIATVFTTVGRWILRLFGIGHGHVAVATEEDIRALALLSAEAGEIEPEEVEILESLFKLADRPVRDVMTPRLDVVALESPISLEEARGAVTDSGHSRFPVVPAGGTLDDVVGVLYVKDIVRHERDDRSIDRSVREPYFVPEATSILTALQGMRRQMQSFAVVLDEHGGVDGVVTIKDLVSELIGDIQDEYDPKEPSVIRLGPSSWMVEGLVPVEDLEDAVGRPLPRGPYSSTGGLFLAVGGAIPDVGDAVEVDGVTMTVIRMDRRRIDRVRVDLAPRSGAHGADSR